MERGERGREREREGKIEGRGLHKQESGSSEMAESERLNLSTDGDDVCRVLVSGPAGLRVRICVCLFLFGSVCVFSRRQI